MSAHVVPKAQAFASDEDEKTTIESGWEDEASTTIEQGEVAEKLRSFNGEALRRNGTNITSTNGGALDEPTVDDRRVNVAVAAPVVAPARLVITQGNDTGQELEVRPGKAYTIGRAIDNDLVLTDIAVSRKHFDLRHEAGAWVIVDRGSGNGTVVNGAVEDQPFMLAHGDVIEIGNTSFRFDHPGGAPRGSGFTMDLDEEEASTVAGKPMREEPLAPPVQPVAALPRRPRTVPPPAPLPRPRPPSVGPPPAYGFGAPAPLPAATLPMPQQVNRAPAIAAQPPAMLGADPMMRQPMLPVGGPRPLHEGVPMQGMLPTTIPGQGPPVAPSLPQSRPLPYAYPNLADLPPQHAQLRVNGTAPRDATSTALVQPAPYGQLAPPQYQTTLSTPQLSKRTKMVIGLAGLTVVVTIATVAILKGTANDRKPTPAAGKTAPTVESIESPAPTQPSKPDGAKVDVANTATTKPDATKADAAKADAAKADAATADAAKANAAKADAERAEAAKRDAERAEAAKRDAERAEAAKRDAERAEAAKRDATAKADAAKAEAAKREAAKRDADAAKREAAAREAARRDEAKREAAAKAEAAKREREEARRAAREREQQAEATARTTTRVAAVDASAAKSTADRLYRSKKFSDAAATVRKAAAATSGAEASQLKTLAGAYEQVGRNYNVGMGPATKPTEAVEALTRAQNVDRSAGGAFEDEIRAKLAQVAPKAAIAYAAAKQWEAAARTVRIAESIGAGNASTKAVREKLEAVAGELYASAIKELDDDPDGARAKLRQVKAMVDAKSPWAAKAQKALNGGG